MAFYCVKTGVLKEPGYFLCRKAKPPPRAVPVCLCTLESHPAQLFTEQLLSKALCSVPCAIQTCRSS